MKASAILSSFLLGAAVAQDQVPLKEKAAGWFDKAKSYIPTVSPSIPNPVNAAAAAAAAAKVHKITIRNYKRLLAPSPEGDVEWLVYLTGGNKTCFGRCGQVDLTWNESVPILATLPQPAGSPELKLGRIDCEKDNVLCNGWGAACPSLYHFDFSPNLADGRVVPTPIRVVDLNVTTTTVQDIVTVARNAPKSRLAEIPEYNGVLHPIDGVLANLGIQEYLGWLIYGMGTTPSWMIMIGISFFSRQFMSRRMANQRPDVFSGTPRPAAGGAPAPAAKPATPGSAKGGKKRR